MRTRHATLLVKNIMSRFVQAQEAVDLEPWAGGQVGPDCKLSAARMWYDKHDYYMHVIFLISLD